MKKIKTPESPAQSWSTYRSCLLKEIDASKKRLRELEKAQGGGTVVVTLKTDNLQLMYRKGRKPEPFYVTGMLRGIPQIMNVSEI